MPTPNFLDFDTDGLDGDANQVAQALSRQPATYVNHLLIALHLDTRATQTVQGGPGPDDQQSQGYIKAMREVAAQLRQGDFLPGGALLEEPTDPGERFKAR